MVWDRSARTPRSSDASSGQISTGTDEAGRRQGRQSGTCRRGLQLPTPNGFAVTTAACRRFLEETGLRGDRRILADLVDDDPPRLEAVSGEIIERIMETPVPAAMERALQAAAQSLRQSRPGGAQFSHRRGRRNLLCRPVHLDPECCRLTNWLRPIAGLSPAFTRPRRSPTHAPRP